MDNPEAVFHFVKSIIMAKKGRDLQKKIGPSDIGDPCDYCLATKLMGKTPHGGFAAPRDDGFSLKGWGGTAVHEKLERDMAAAGMKGLALEAVVPVGKIKGYGKINGHVDLTVFKPSPILVTKGAVVCDYKTDDIANIRKMKKEALGNPKWNVKPAHRVQRAGYGVGVEAGLKIEVGWTMNIYIPRDNNDPDEIWYHAEEFDPSIWAKALKRAERLYRDFAVHGPAKIETLSTDPSCYRCNGFYRNISFKEEA